MNILDRLILGIYTFCLAAISLFIVLILTHVVPYAYLNTYINVVRENSDYAKIAIAIAVIFFLVSLRFLLSGIGRKKAVKAVEKTSELGSIIISLTSIESIILSAVKELDGIMEIKTVIERAGDGVKVELKAVVTPERSIPELSAVIQARTKEAVERVAGIGVSSIEVLVEDVVQTIRPAVRSQLR